MACEIGREALDIGHDLIEPGITTEEIDRVIHDFIISKGAYPSPLNYFGFPRSCCTSINEIIAHGIPDSRPLKKGDVINLDISVYKNGCHGDLNETFIVGEGDFAAKKLVKATYDCLQKAIAICKPGTMYRSLGNVISDHVEPLGF